MQKSTLTTYTIASCSMHICNADEEIIFNDHSANEILSIEGISPDVLRGAIMFYVRNMSLRGDDRTSRIAWLKDMHAQISASLSMLEGATNG